MDKQSADEQCEANVVDLIYGDWIRKEEASLTDADLQTIRPRHGWDIRGAGAIGANGRWVVEIATYPGPGFIAWWRGEAQGRRAAIAQAMAGAAGIPPRPG
jgi:hypothetical protein